MGLLKACQNKKGLQSDCQGMILTEVLVATVILSVGLVVIIQALAASLRAVVLANDYTEAAFLVENQLVEYLLKGPLDTTGEEQGRVHEPSGRFSYVFSRQPASLVLAGPQLYESRVKISWMSGSKQEDLELVTLLPVKLKAE